ncbi:MAG: flippase-like domain-containing protein [Polyangiaceae bacterium]|nr:flippase-like domain-containing protein [Polyangiaceae bacterium]
MVRAVAIAIALALFAWTLRDVDASALGALLVSVGPLGALALVPQLSGSVLHAGAWRQLLAGLGHKKPLLPLTSISLSADAARMAAPAGPAVAESIAAFELRRRLRVPWSPTLTSLAAKKAWVFCSNAAAIALLLMVGQHELGRLAAFVPRGAFLPHLALAASVALAVLGSTSLGLLSSPRVALGVKRVMTRLPSRGIQAWIRRHLDRPAAGATAALPWSRHGAACAYLLGQWATDILETWLMLHLLGARASLPAAMMIELGTSLVRSAAFVVPGGLGFQDASYAGMISSLGVTGNSEIGAAFVLMKRAKELIFTSIGLALLAVSRRPR